MIGFCVPADQPVGPRRRVHRQRAAVGRRAHARCSASSPRPTSRRPEQVAERLTQLTALMEFAEIVPCSARRRLPGRPARRPARRPPARGPAALPGRRADRRAGGDAGRRADPRGRAGGRARRAAALDRRGDRGDGAARGPRRPCSTCTPPSTSSAHSQKGIVIGKGGERLRAGRQRRPPADRGAARHEGLPRPARQGGQGLAARPAPAAQAGLLSPHGGVERPTRSGPSGIYGGALRRRTMVSTPEDTTETSRPREGRP